MNLTQNEKIVINKMSEPEVQIFLKKPEKEQREILDIMLKEAKLPTSVEVAEEQKKLLADRKARQEKVAETTDESGSPDLTE